MRASELIGLPVVGPNGRHGQVLDVRLVQDGPLRGAYAALRVEGLVVGHHTLAAHLGYDRASTRGPWLVRVVVQALTRSNRFVPWAEVRLEDGVVRTDRDALDELEKI
jgi:hypothetical protein